MRLCLIFCLGFPLKLPPSSLRGTVHALPEASQQPEVAQRVPQLGHTPGVWPALLSRVRNLHILATPVISSQPFSPGRVSTWLRGFIRHLWVLGFNLIMFPFLFLAFASLDGGSVPLLLLSFLVFHVVSLPMPLDFSWAHQAAAVPTGCCFLLSRTMWKLWIFLEEEGAKHQN